MRATPLLLLLFTLFLSLPQASKAAGDIEIAGDIVQILIPSVAYGTTLYLHDEKGETQMYQSFFTTVAITQSLKYGINRKRPNGGNHSFPSGHTSAALQGAAFIHQRYGLKPAIPAYIGAAFVGYSRIYADKHFGSDVLAGALIGTLSSFYFTEPYQQGLSITPTATKTGYGLQLSKRW